MPSTYAHYRFGREILSGLPEAFQAVIQPHRDLYDMGLHGPDLLFYDHPLWSTPVNRVGFGTHDRPAQDFFAPAAELLTALDHPPAHLAYLYGFLCHFALDRACHGYIDEKIAASGVRHTEIEMEFDRMLLVEDGMDPVRQSLTDHIHPSRSSAAVIAEFFPDVTAKQVFHAQKSFVFYNRLLIAPGRAKRQLIFSLLRLTGNYREMHGLVMSLHPDPRCEDSNRVLSGLYREAVPVARQLIETWEDTARGQVPWDNLYRYTFGSKYIPLEESAT